MIGAVNEPNSKQAEIDYPMTIGEEGRTWLRNKPFWHEPRMTARLLIDFGYVLQILDLHPGMSLVELGCGSGWIGRCYRGRRSAASAIPGWMPRAATPTASGC